VVRRHLVPQLAAFLMQPDPPALALGVVYWNSLTVTH
jgi:hypothetical protein